MEDNFRSSTMPVALSSTRHESQLLVEDPSIIAAPEVLKSLDERTTNVHVPAASIPDLSQVSAILQRSRRKSAQAREKQHRLHELQVLTAYGKRLVVGARSIQNTLTQCVEQKKKQQFADLFNSFHDVVEQCLHPTSNLHDDDFSPKESHVTYPPSFLDLLSPHSKDAIRDLLYKVRYDGQFLASRLGSLSPATAKSLRRIRSSARSNESMFSSSSHTETRSVYRLETLLQGHTRNLQASRYSFPLQTLFQSVRGITGCQAAEDAREIDVWAGVCSKLIAAQKRDLVPAILDLFVRSSAWHGKERLESWINETIHGGAFLLDRSPPKASFKDREQGKFNHDPGAKVARADAFNQAAADKLLVLLGDTTGSSLIPERVLQICSATWNKLQTMSVYAPSFPEVVLDRWLHPFINDVVSSADSYGLMTECYISPDIRDFILIPTLTRVQNAIFSVVSPWKTNVPAPHETTSQVHAIMAHMYGQASQTSSAAHRGGRASPVDRSEPTFLAISEYDTVCIINALYPQQTSDNLSIRSSHGDRSGLRSSRSSLSGFSLFQPAASIPNAGNGSPLGNLEELASALPPPTPSTNISDASILSPEGSTDSIRDAYMEMYSVTQRSGTHHKAEWSFLIDCPESKRLATTNEALNNASEDLSRSELWVMSNHMDRGSWTQPRRGLWDSHTAEIQDQLAGIQDLLGRDYDSQGSVKSMDCSYHQQLLNMFEQLYTAFERQVEKAESTDDYLAAHDWSRRAQSLKVWSASQTSLEMLARYLEDMQTEASQSIHHSHEVIRKSEDWTKTLKLPREQTVTALLDAGRALEAIRDKMYFVTDVKNTGEYEDLQTIAAGLSTMVQPQGQQSSSPEPSRRYRRPQNGRNQASHDEINPSLSASKHEGGPNKLNDQTTKRLLAWIKENGYLNMCPGEERIHVFCQQVRLCLERLISPDRLVAWEANSLYMRRSLPSSALSEVTGPPVRRPSISTNGSSRYNEAWSVSPALMHDPYATPRSPRSNEGLWSSSLESPSMTSSFSRDSIRGSPSALRSTKLSISETIARRSNPSNCSLRSAFNRPSRDTTKLVRRLTNFLLMDLGLKLFAEGSETDKALWTGISGAISHEYFDQVRRQLPELDSATLTVSPFNFDRAFRRMLHELSLSLDPQKKLDMLSKIETLLKSQDQSHENDLKTTELDNARLFGGGQLSTNPLDSPHVLDHDDAASSRSVMLFRRLFVRQEMRPSTIFRDLQYIAAFVPQDIITSTPKGLAFRSACEAMRTLKKELVEDMTQIVDSYINDQLIDPSRRNQPVSRLQQEHDAFFPSSRPALWSRNVGSMTLKDAKDAGEILQIAAKEGHPVAQRELALMYTTDFESHLKRCLMPLTEPSLVFKHERMWEGGAESHGIDSSAMCVATHWMMLACAAGDEVAKGWVHQNLPSPAK